jgi:hypothetical protein
VFIGATHDCNAVFRVVYFFLEEQIPEVAWWAVESFIAIAALQCTLYTSLLFVGFVEIYVAACAGCLETALKKLQTLYTVFLVWHVMLDFPFYWRCKWWWLSSWASADLKAVTGIKLWSVSRRW